jgi:hypothetical protein
MSPFSAPVLGGAALLSSPAWWNVVQGVSPASDAAVRFLVCVALCWAALEGLAVFVGPAPRVSSTGGPGDEHTDDPRAAERHRVS